MAAIAIGFDAGFHVDLVGVRINIGEDRPAKASLFQHVERMCGDRHVGKAAIGHEQRLFDAERLAGFRQFLDPATAKLDGGGIAPVGDDIHFVTFFRW
ncbi:hypothetical protein D3C80_1267320 [compost metagenome]